MNSHCEDLYLEAEQAIRNSDYVTAKRNYDEILQEEPTSACAHNSLGWLYKTQFDDYIKAEKHYKAAIRYEPNYPHPYWHLADLYSELERWDDLLKLLQQCLTIPVLDKSILYNRFGIMEELSGNFAAARNHYTRSLLFCLNNEKLEDYKKDLERCDYKMGLNK